LTKQRVAEQFKAISQRAFAAGGSRTRTPPKEPPKFDIGIHSRILKRVPAIIAASKTSNYSASQVPIRPLTQRYQKANRAAEDETWAVIGVCGSYVFARLDLLQGERTGESLRVCASGDWLEYPTTPFPGPN